MAPNTVTYFGEVINRKNTNLVGNLTVLGTTLLNNIVSKLDQVAGIGQSTLAFNSFYATTANTTTLNSQSITSPLAISTLDPSNTNVYIQGNLFAANYISATIFNAHTINVGSALNVNFITNCGLNGPAGGATFSAPGNVFATQSFGAPRILASGTINTSTANATTLVVSANVGIGTDPVVGGPTLAIRGNMYTLNSISVSNAVFTTLANTGTVNTSSISNASGFVQVGTATPSGTTLYVQGDMKTTSTINAALLATSTSLVASDRSNTMTVVIRSNVGIGTNPMVGGPALHLVGNLYTSINVNSPILISNTVNAASVTNTTTIVITNSAGIGGANLNLSGNTFVSNSVNSGNVYANLANSQTVNTNSIHGFICINAPGTTGYTMNINGNVYTTAPLTAYSITSNSSNVSAIANGMSLAVSANVGIGTPPVVGGPTLAVQGNMYTLNSVSVSNAVFATRANTGTVNASSISGLVGISTTSASSTGLFVPGNVTSTISTSTVSIKINNSNISAIANGMSLTVSANVGIGTAPVVNGPTLSIQGNMYTLNSISVSNTVSATLSNTGTINASSISGLVGISTTSASSTGLFVSGNANVTVGISAPIVFANTEANITGTTGTTNFVTKALNVGVGTGATGNSLEVSGNAFVASTVTTPTVSSETMNTATMNTNSIFGKNSFIGVGTSVASGTSLFLSGNLYASNTITTKNVFINAASMTGVGTALSVTCSAVGIGTLIATGGPSLFVAGNINVVNSVTTTNVFLTTMNVINNSNILSFEGATNIGISVGAGQSSVALTRNVYASNAVTTLKLAIEQGANTPIMNTSFISSSVGLGGVSGGYALRITGNLYVSNTLSTANISSNSVNVQTTLNTQTLVTQVVLANALGWSNTNIYISNSITTTNIFATNVNASAYYTTSGSLGVGTEPGAATLTVLGNLVCSNTIWSIPDVSVSNGLYYIEDITKRYPHLLPTPSNAASIKSWISSTCNAISQPTDAWWATSTSLTTGNLASTTTAISYAWIQPILLPDGRVLIISQDQSVIGFFNPFTNEFSTVSVPNMPVGTVKWRSGVLTPNGNVVLIPCAQSNIGVFNPVSYAYSNIRGGLQSSGDIWFQGGVLAPNGNVICVPRDSPNICVVNPTLFTASNVGPIAGSGLDLFAAGVLLPSGNVVFAPLTSANIGMFNPTNLTYSNVGPIKDQGSVYTLETGVLAPDGNIVMIPFNSGNVVVYDPTQISTPLPGSAFSNIRVGGTGGALFFGGVLAPTGNIICVPFSSGNVGMIDPVALTYSNIAPHNSTNSCRRCVLVPDGRIIAPRNDANVIFGIGGFGPASTELCLSPYFNKF